MDWTDALSSLKDTLPEGTEPAETQVATDPKKPRLDIILEKKGRAGKTATIITGFAPDSDDEVRRAAAALKSALGTGGSARGGEILIQGDRRADVARKLAEMGYKSRTI